jgi:hypothetical protein
VLPPLLRSAPRDQWTDDRSRRLVPFLAKPNGSNLAQTALALARLMDNPRALSQQPPAAAKLADILRELRKGADARKSRLASVRAMTSEVGSGQVDR